MSIELRHLRYFIAVAEEAHITRAAERLGMQQPPLSQQIKALEQYLGVRLFHRKARGVELTDAGLAFLDDARRILSLLDHAVETTRRTARGEQGRICVGVTPTAPFHPFVQQVLRSFQDAYPMVALTLEENLTHDILRFQHDQVDVAFIRNRVANTEGLLIMPLLEEAMWAALPGNHKLAGRQEDRALRMEHLAQESFILYGPPGSGIHDATIAACQAAGFSPRVSQRAPRIISALGLVASGLGVALVPESMRCVLLPGVTYRQIDGPVQATAALNLVARRGDASPVVRHFVGMVSAQIKDYSAP